MRIRVIFYLVILIFSHVFVFGDKMDCNNQDSFKIILWNNSADDKIEDLEKFSYNELLKKYEPLNIISTKYIIKYYWNEQIIEVDFDKMKNDGFIGTDIGFFTIVLDDEIIYHGLNRVDITPINKAYDNSNYPAITRNIYGNPYFLLLKPKYKELFMTFKDYPKNLQDKLLNKDVFNYFNKQNKIVHGYFDLDKLFNEGK